MAGRVNSSNNRSRSERNYRYVYGSAVPKPVERPYRYGEAVPEEKPVSRPQRKSRYDEETRANNERIARRNRERSLRIDLRYTVFLMASVLVITFACIFYLRMTSIVNDQNRQITALRSELTSITDENVAARERINSAIDLDYVYKVASEQLGMKYAEESQIVHYHNTNNDYVKQFKDIPE